MTRHLATLRAVWSPRDPPGAETISQPVWVTGHRDLVVEPRPVPRPRGRSGLRVVPGPTAVTARRDFRPGAGGPSPLGMFLAVARCRDAPRSPSSRRVESPRKERPQRRRKISSAHDPRGFCVRVIVTPAVYPRLFEFLHFDIQSTGQKSHCVNTTFWPSQCYVLIRQSDSPCPYQFQVGC